MLLAKFKQFPFRQIGVGFDFHDGGLYPSRFQDRLYAALCDIREANGSAFTFLHKELHSLPGLCQGCVFVVDDVPLLISGILVVSRLESKGSMYQITIDIIELKPAATCFKSGPDSFGAMIVIPKFCSYEYVLSPDFAVPEDFLDGISDKFLISVAFGTIDMPKSYIQRINNRLCCD